jgi:hypothetical protein
VVGLRPSGIERVRFLAAAIRFDGYPFVGATVYPHGNLGVGLIASVDTHAAPPEIHTVEDETLLVSAVHAGSLATFAERHGIADVRRRDVWHLVLDVFFDPPPDHARLENLLQECGLDQPQVDGIRARVTPFVGPYVEGRWFDWPHLGLYHLLVAYQAIAPGPASRAKSREVYWWAMEIAAKGIVKSPVW